MTLTEPQRLAVESQDAKILLLSGAGAGKSRVLCERIKRLVANGVDPKGIVAITYTVAAAKVMQERLEGIQLGYCSTLHSWCLRFIKQFGSAIGYGERITVITKEQSDNMVVRSILECRFKGTAKEVEYHLKDGMFALQSKAKRGHLDKAGIVAQTYFKTLREGQMLDFDGILFAALELLSVHDQKPSPMPSHLLVDEAQDGSDNDFDIYELSGIPSQFIVGDPRQAIFGFRGGRVENILGLAKPSSGFALFHLTQNFRCARSIVAAANTLIEHNTGLASLPMESATGKAGTVTVTQFQDPFTERNGVELQVRNAISRGISPCEIAVLCRTNRIAREFSDQFEAGGIPVAKKKRQSRPEDWSRLASFVALLSNPDNDALALHHIEQFHGKEARSHAQMTAFEAMKSVNDAVLGFAYTTLPKDVPELASRIGIGREALDKLEEVVKTLPSGSLLDELTFAMSRDENHDGEMGEGVTVTTGHAAKGREWEVVFLPSFEQGIFPQCRKDSDIEEERRLAFVCFTRAKEFLHISHCDERVLPWGDKKPVECESSQFLKESDL